MSSALLLLQAEFDDWSAGLGMGKHGMWHDQADVVEVNELVQMLLSQKVSVKDGAYILVLGSVVTCPSMTVLFRELIQAILCDARPVQCDLRSAALRALARFEECGLSEVAELEIKDYTANALRAIPSAMHIGDVVRGFEKNKKKIDAFCQHLTSATDDRSIFEKRTVFDSLHNELSKCGGGFGRYQAGRFLRTWFYVHGKFEPPEGRLPTTMPDGLYDDVPEHLRCIVPYGKSAFQWGFELCMLKKKVRHVDPELVVKLRKALTSTSSPPTTSPPPSAGERVDDDPTPPDDDARTKRKRGDCDARGEEGCSAGKKKHKQQTLNLQPATNARADDHAPAEVGITRIMATSQRSASGTTIFKGKGPHCYGEETLEFAWVKRNIKKWFLEAVVYPELGKWHKAPLGSAVSDSASAAGGASGGGGAHNSGSICEWFCR